MKTHLSEKVDKGWGYELIFASNDMYCGKILHFNDGGETSLHFHKLKHETWYVYSGEYIYTEIDTKDGSTYDLIIGTGDIIVLDQFSIHRLKAIKGGDIFEVSTQDFPDDSYRVSKGDSQKKTT